MDVETIPSSLGRFEKAVPGFRTERVPLPADGKREETEFSLCIPLTCDPCIPTPLILAFHGTGGSGKETPGQRARMMKEADKRTARLELKREGPGRFTALGSGVSGFRLLLTQEMLAPKNAVFLKWQGRAYAARTVAVDKAVALCDFSERFDRGWIPVAEFRGP